MNEKPRQASGSLIERAAAVYGFERVLRDKASPATAPLLDATAPASAAFPAPPNDAETFDGSARRQGREFHTASEYAIDRARLRDGGLIVPGAPPTALSEEFRLVKRQLLLSALGSDAASASDLGRAILVCSAQPGEGKTFCAVNLALSMASETDTRVLLIDADVAKPSVAATLGLPAGAGLIDLLTDPALDPEAQVMRTDVTNLSVLPAGKQSHDDTELLASARTRTLIRRLMERDSRRILIFDSAPALAASPASVLALHVGQVLMVVRADLTPESELRDALTLVGGAPRISLILNAVTFGGSTRKFGSYYGFGN